MEASGVEVGELSPAIVERLLAERRQQGYASRISLKGLRRLLGYLDGQGVLAADGDLALTPVDRLVEEFRGYLRDERGLVPGSIELYARIARRFLGERAEPLADALAGLSGREINTFVLAEARRVSPRTAETVVCALRALLRFLHVQGWIAMPLVVGIWPALNAGQFGPEHAHVIRNALVEAFAVHARGVSDFLFCPPRDDDAAAEQFFAPGEWVRLRGEDISSELQAVRRRTNKEIAHLTYSRLNVPEASKSWMQQAIVIELRCVFFRFVEHVDPELVTHDFKSRAETLRVRPGSPPEAVAWTRQPQAVSRRHRFVRTANAIGNGNRARFWANRKRDTTRESGRFGCSLVANSIASFATPRTSRAPAADTRGS